MFVTVPVLITRPDKGDLIQNALLNQNTILGVLHLGNYIEDKPVYTIFLSGDTQLLSSDISALFSPEEIETIDLIPIEEANTTTETEIERI